jgi:hypothetical protein
MLGERDPDLSIILILVEKMQRRKHDRVQHADDQDLSVRSHSVEDGMLTDQRAKVRRDLTKGPTQLWTLDETLKPSEEPNQVSLGLIVAPSVCRERANVEQVGTCPA